MPQRGGNFLSEFILFRSVFGFKNLQNKFILKYLLGLGVLTNAACEGESEKASTELTEREMNLANIQVYNTIKMTNPKMVQDENVKNTSEDFRSTVEINPIDKIENQNIILTTAEPLDDPVAQIGIEATIDFIKFEDELSSGNVIKGPLQHALVFLDIDGDGRPIDEPFVYTKSDGSYDLLEAFRNHRGTLSKEEMNDADLTVFTFDNTTDTISDKPLPDVILKAPFGSNVVSPLTTIMSQADLTSAEVADLFKITQQDFYNFNPFSASSDLNLALEVEILGLQIASILTTLSGATKGVLTDNLKELNPNATNPQERWITFENMSAGVRSQVLNDLRQELRSNLGASEIVLQEIVKVVKDKSLSKKTLDLASVSDIKVIIEALDLALVSHLSKTDGASTQNTNNAMASFRTSSDKLGQELAELNFKISTISELYSKETVETVSLISNLSEKVFDFDKGKWISPDQISFSGSIQNATDKTGAMKFKGPLDGFSLELENNPLDVAAVHEKNGKFILTWTKNSALTGNSIQLKTVEDPNGSEKFKASKDQTDFIFDYGFMENNSSVKIIVANEGQTEFEYPTQVSNDQIIIIRSSKPKAPLELNEFSFTDGVISLTNSTQANEQIRISESIPAIMVLRTNKDAIVDPVLEANFTATDGQSVILTEPSVWGEVIKIHTSNTPEDAETFIADAGQTKFDFSYNASEKINVFRSKIAKFSRISSEEYSASNGVVTLKSPTEENELVEIRKLPADNKVIDLFSSTNFRTYKPEITRLDENELIIISTASNQQNDQSAILVQLQKRDNEKNGIEYSLVKENYMIANETSIPSSYTTSASRNTEPVLSLADNKNFVVGWTNDTKSQDGKNVEIQVFDENGPVIDKRFTLNDPSYKDQYSLDLVALSTQSKIAATWVEVERDTINTDIIYSHFDISKPSGINLTNKTISVSISIFGQQVPIKVELAESDFIDGDLVMDREAFGLNPEDFINKVSVQYDPKGQFDRLNFDRTSISDIFGARDDLIQAFSKGINLGEELNVNYDEVLGLSVNGPLLTTQNTKITLNHSGSEIPINLILSDANFNNGKLTVTGVELADQLDLGENEQVLSVIVQTDPKGNFDEQNNEGKFTEDPISGVSDNIGTWIFEQKEIGGNLSLNFDPYLGIMVKGIGKLARLNHKNILKDEFHELKISKEDAEELDVIYKLLQSPSRIFVAENDQSNFPFQSEATSDQMIISRSLGNGLPMLPDEYIYFDGVITLMEKAKKNESIKVTTPSSNVMLSINTSSLPYTPNKDNVQVSVEHTGSNQKVILELEDINFLTASNPQVGQNGLVENDLTFTGIQLDKQLNLKPGDTITSIVAQSDPTGKFDQLDINGTFLWDQETKYFDKLGSWTAPNVQVLTEFDINFNPTLIVPEDNNVSIFWTAWNPQIEIYQLIYRRFDDDGNLSQLITLENEFSFEPSDFDVAINGNEIFVTWNKTDEMGNSDVVMSSLDPTSVDESLKAQFENNFITIKKNVDEAKSMPKITFDSENEIFITWIDSPALTKDQLTDFQLVFDLIDLDSLNVPLASYTVPENETIDNLKELTPYLLDQNVNFLEKDLESQLAMLDDKKVQDYLATKDDMIFYVELTDIYNNLEGSDTGIIV